MLVPKKLKQPDPNQGLWQPVRHKVSEALHISLWVFRTPYEIHYSPGRGGRGGKSVFQREESIFNYTFLSTKSYEETKVNLQHLPLTSLCLSSYLLEAEFWIFSLGSWKADHGNLPFVSGFLHKNRQPSWVQLSQMLPADNETDQHCPLKGLLLRIGFVCTHCWTFPHNLSRLLISHSHSLFFLQLLCKFCWGWILGLSTVQFVIL